MRVAGVLYYLHADHLGSVTLTTDGDGDVVARRLHRPYGATRYSWGTLTTEYGYTGQREVAGIGLVYMHARWYDAYLNRWIQPDTIVPNPANPQSLSRYSYAYNQPLVYIDSDGHNPIVPWLIAGGAGVIVGIGIALEVVPHLRPYDPPMMITDNALRAPAPTSSNLTPWLRNQMVTNAQSPVAQSIRGNWTSGDPLRMDAALQAWTSLVGTGAIWDFKVNIQGARWFADGTRDVMLGGRWLNYDAVANMHFGFVGRAAGLGEGFLVMAAGLAQWQLWQRTDLPEDKGVCNLACFCDHPYATWSVHFGSYLYDLYGDRLDELDDAALAAALEEYIRLYGEPPAPPPGAVAE